VVGHQIVDAQTPVSARSNGLVQTRIKNVTITTPRHDCPTTIFHVIHPADEASVTGEIATCRTWSADSLLPRSIAALVISSVTGLA